MRLKKHKKIIALLAVLFIFYAIINGAFSIYREIKGDSINLSILDPNGTAAVTFNPNGGTISSQEATRNVTVGTAVGTLPTTMAKTDYNFDGWYTDPTNGEKINENTIVTGSTVTYYAHWIKIVCKKAVAGTLHSETCASDGSCAGAGGGYSANDTIYYGTIPGENSPIVGDAYDCDVNDDGTWDPITERFYYVRGYGATNPKENSVLVHFTSFDGQGQMDSSYSRDSRDYITALGFLPTSSTWDNPALIEMDGNITRFISTEDITAACGSSTGGNHFANCRFYLENTRYQSLSLGRAGIWILSDGNTYHRIHTESLQVATVENTSLNTARPTIQIPTNTIEQYLSPSTYTITFDPGQGSLDDPSESSREVYDGATIGTLPIATREHYTFDGWYTDPTNGTQITEGTTISADATYYAHWIANIVTTFNANGGTVSPSSKEIATGSAIGSMPVPEYTRHEFLGWFTEQTNGTEITENTTFNANTEIFAHWQETSMEYAFYIPGECTFSSTGISNGPNGDCISTINPTGSNIDYTDATLSAKKYIDTGIALYNTTNHDRDYEIHFEIESYVPTDNVDQATFFNTKNEATGYPGVVVRKNGDSKIQIASRKTSGNNQQVEINYNQVTKLSVYRIEGTIYYSLNDGDRTLINDLTQYNPIFDLTTWFGGAPTNAQATTVQRVLNGTLKNMYIKLGPIPSAKATVTFDPNYQGTSTFTQMVTKGQAIGTLPTPTRTGYTLLGWFTDPTNGNQITSSTIINADITYYAHWHEDVTVTLQTNGGTVSPNTITVPYNTAVGTLPTPTKTNNTFVGWYQDQELTNPATSSTIITDDTDFYAKWLPDVTVTLNPNNGTVTPTTITVGQGQAVGTLPTPERAGYTFDGWYQDQELTNPATSSTVINQDTSFYAKWIEIITITFNADGGTVTPNTKTFSAGTAIGELPTPVYSGYEFIGWFTDNTYTTEVTTSTIFNSSTTIIAKWEETEDITVTFDADGGTVSPTTKTFAPETPIGQLPTPAKTDYLFVGWFTDSTYTTEVTETTTFNTTTTIIAKWVDETYVACIGATCYTTLQDAATAVPSTGEKTTIKILQDINVTATTTIPDTKHIELDIGTHVISTSTKSVNIFTNEGTLDIKNGTITSSAENGTTKSGYVIKNIAGATLNIAGGTLSYTRTNDGEGKVIESNGTVNITGGTLSCESQAAVINANSGGTLNVSGGTITGSNTVKGQAIYNDGSTTTISGNAYLTNVSNDGTNGKKNGRAALTNNAGTVTILGGTIISENNAAVSNKGTMIIGTDDGTIDITSPLMQGNTYGLENTSGTVTIYDGIFKGKASTNNKAIKTESTVNHGTYDIAHGNEIIDGEQYTTAYLEDTTISYTVTFNKNGGDTVTTNTKTFNEVSPIGELPTATKANTEFLGWFTSASGGDRVFSTTEVSDDVTYYAHYTNSITVCRPALTLHSSGGTDFGQIHSGSSLSPGDAYDCDVNGDGTYDATNERFYYLTNASNGKAVFIFSNNTHQGQSDVTPMCKPDAVAYGQNFTDGPNTAIEELPTTAQWSNVNIYTEPRTITNQTGTTVTSNYVYTGKAARLATLDEIKAATSSGLNETTNELASYSYLLENTISYGDCRSNYWLETTNSNGGAVRIDGATDAKRLGHATGNSAVRPVIEVPYTSIEGTIDIVEFDTIPIAMRTYFNNVSTWNIGQDDTNYSSFNNSMITNLNNYNCAYYQNDNTGTQYGSVFCDQPNQYDTGVTGEINVYEYNESTGVRSNSQASYVFNNNGKLYNFIPGKTYYWESASDSTKNGYVRPTGERRLITIPGTTRQTRNVRDLGGLPVDTDGDGTIDGKTKFAKIYRGEKIWGTNRNGVTRAQFEKLGIYNELDLRTQGSEIVASEEDQLSNYIPNEIVHYKIDHTEFGTNSTEFLYGKTYYQAARDAAIDVMQRIVAGNDDYAIFFHCRIGADRTGTLAYILEGLLGVPTEYRHQDYELTTFFGLRERTRYYYNKSDNYYKFLYLKKAIRHATSGNNEITGEENVMDWFLLEGNSTNECNDISALITQFRAKMIDYN